MTKLLGGVEISLPFGLIAYLQLDKIPALCEGTDPENIESIKVLVRLNFEARAKPGQISEVEDI